MASSSAKKPITIDCEYLKPRFAASYLLVSPSRDGTEPEAAFIDNNTAHSVPRLLQALTTAGLKPEQVRYVIITHVHLDHAGGTSLLMQACPAATLLAHPRAAPHMIDPSRLVGSARKVYGDEQFERLYGQIGPIDANRVRAIEDGERVSLGDRELRFIHTRGHANHHFCIHDPASGSVFTGDSFGLAYPALQKGQLFIFPSTSPTDFDPAEALASLRKIVATGAESAYLTHYGEVKNLAGAEAQLRMHLEFSEKLLNEAIACPHADSELDAYCLEKLRKHFQSYFERSRLPMSQEDWELLALDLELNAQGIAHVARKRRAPKSGA